MAEWIQMLFVKIFGANSWLATLIISMIPIVELRGAIPFGAATSFWGANALPLWLSFLVSVIGSSIVCVILTFLFWPILNWLKRTRGFKKLAFAVENKLNKNSKNIDNKVKKESDAKKIFWLKFWGVLVFVAIPLPLTGVWTGTCIGLFVGLTKAQTMLAVIPGNLLAGIIMTIISYFFADNTMIVLLVFLGLVVLFVLFAIIKALISKLKNKKSSSESIEIPPEEIVVKDAAGEIVSEETIDEAQPEQTESEEEQTETEKEILEEIEEENPAETETETVEEKK